MLRYSFGCSGMKHLKKTPTYSRNILVRHLFDPEPSVYEGTPFIVVFWGTWGMLQGTTIIFLQTSMKCSSHNIIVL